MLIVGFGKLAQMVVGLNKEADMFYVYNRTVSKLEEAKKENKKIHIIHPEQFASFSRIFLALPRDALFSFLKKYAHHFKEKSLFFHTATMVKKEEVEAYLPSHQVVPLKYAGHSLQAMRENNGNTFVIPPGYEREKHMIKKWLGPSFSVVTGKEEEVLVANELAVEETMKLVVRLTEQLEAKKISTPIQKAVLSHIPAGVIHAHLNGEHGAFAKKVLERWEKGKRDET